MKKDKLSRKEREQLQRRTEILQAALELFSQKGYHNVSMQEIAARAEFAVGTIYKFFKNKEELYREVLMQTAILICSTLSKVLEEKGDEYITIRNIWKRNVNFLWKTSRLYNFTLQRWVAALPLMSRGRWTLNCAVSMTERFESWLLFLTRVFKRRFFIRLTRITWLWLLTV
jgi:AcrR family transcriptional regulator